MMMMMMMMKGPVADIGRSDNYAEMEVDMNYLWNSNV